MLLTVNLLQLTVEQAVAISDAIKSSTNKLEALEICHTAVQNPVISIPPLIGAVSQTLRNLKLSHANLTAFPPEIFEIKQLEVLYIDNNQVSYLFTSQDCSQQITN